MVAPVASLSGMRSFVEGAHAGREAGRAAGRPRSRARARGCGSSGPGPPPHSAPRACVKARWWCTSSMLAFCSATHAVTFASEPGRSRTSTRTRARRPARTMPRSMISASISGSMLPPHRTRPTLRPRKRSGCAQDGREARRARALHHRLLDLEQHHDRLLDVALVHEQHVGHRARDDLPRDPARLLHRDALGDGGGAEHRRRAAQRVVHRREAHRSARRSPRSRASGPSPPWRCRR